MCFIELEDARKTSIFVEKRRDETTLIDTRAPYFEWAPRFDHGASQILDWIRILDDQRQTDDFRSHFGSRKSFDPTFLLVIGRSRYLDDALKERMAWRSQNVSALHRKMRAVTYDEVLDEVTYMLDVYGSIAMAGASLPLLPAAT